jgi:DNA-binding transcriptional ArsR family regulator
MAPAQDERDAVWRALSDPSRRQILDLLRERPRTVGELCEPFARTHSRFAVMKHLRVLKQAELVVDRKEGRRRWNHLNAVPLRRVYERWVTRYESAWAGALLNLERRLEGSGAKERAMASSGGQPTVGEFHIEQEVVLGVKQERAWRAVLEVDGWWCHYHAKKKPKIVLEPHAGGRFFETGPEGETLFANVQSVKAPEHLRLIGPMGMGRLPVLGVIDINLESRGESTLLKLSHRAYGVLDPEWKESHERGWGKLWPHLKDLAERGIRYSG